jgi:uncharacterized protein
VFIEIEDLESEPLHVQHLYQRGEIQFSHEDAVISEPVRTDFVLDHKDRDLRIEGSIETAIRFKCSRCVKDFSRKFSTAFDLFYLPQPDWAKRGDEIELKYEDMEVAFYDGIRFDVDLMVLEQIELGMPMKFVCSEECKGLCYVCGADLNEGPCRCKKDEKDARLSVLLDFRKKMKDKS